MADAEWRASRREGNGRTAACTQGMEGKLSRKSAATADQRTIKLRDEERMSICTKAKRAMTEELICGRRRVDRTQRNIEHSLPRTTRCFALSTTLSATSAVVRARRECGLGWKRSVSITIDTRKILWGRKTGCPKLFGTGASSVNKTLASCNATLI